MNRRCDPRNYGSRAGQSVFFAALLFLFAGTAHQASLPTAGRTRPSAQAKATAQTTYASPEAALAALVTAVEAKDRPTLNKLFGPDSDQLFSGDPVQDNRALEHFGASLGTSAKLQKEANGYTILVGAKGWPFPVPIVAQGDRWRFDTKAGLNEILNRRVGEDELAAIATCRAYVLAQWQYYTTSGAELDGLAVYAQRFISTPGTHDGLYWPTRPGEKPSPLGDLIASRRAEGYGPRNRMRTKTAPGVPRSYNGYYFHILTRQGPSAPGGKFNYIINGNMIAGYALIAYPARWGNTGVMTFIVNNQGRVYQKNLGPDTDKIAAAMTEYNPDPTWQLVQP